MATNNQDGPRERVLDAASRLFYEQGFHATGVNQVIDEAGVAKASFYDHFGSKENLGVAYLKQRHRTWFTALQDRIGEYAQSQDRLLAPFEFLEDWVAEPDFRGCAFLNIVSEFPNGSHPIRDAARRHKDELRETFLELTHSALNDTLSDTEIERIANELYLLFEGAIIASQNFEATWPAESARATARALLDQHP